MTTFLRPFLTLIAVVLISTAFAGFAFANQKCGTLQAIKFNQGKNLSKRTQVMSSSLECRAEDLYDSVYTRKTEHFQILYTVSGPHAATSEFIDSLAESAEYAWNFHTKKLGMLQPLGTSVSYHYQKKIDNGLYPIEVIDLGLLRNTWNILDGICSWCYGLTLPSDQDPSHSELLIDNDFLTVPNRRVVTDTINVAGNRCVYSLATEEIRNIAHDYSYVDNWAAGIRVTTVHELYHAVQIRYLNIYRHWSFWFEASASGIEEIAAPHIDDYIGYLPTVFRSVGTPLDQMIEDYGAGLLFIYLYNHVQKDNDKFIWEGFKRQPNKNFQEQLESFISSKGLSVDSIFHDFATRLSFSGNRAHFLNPQKYICSDQKDWPDIKFTKNENDSDFVPSVNDFAYRFYDGGWPVKKSAIYGSAILYRGDSASILPLNGKNYDNQILLESKLDPLIDSVAWIFSNFANRPITSKEPDSTLRAFPTPWRNGWLCFSPLPHNGKFIEIRNRRGNLITRVKYEDSITCMDESQVRNLMVPGVYRYRVGNHGKLKEMIIIY